MTDVADVDETPTVALLEELSKSYAWRQVQARMIRRRDQYVASLTGLDPEKTHQISHHLGFIKALNEMAQAPEILLETATRELKKATK